MRMSFSGRPATRAIFGAALVGSVFGALACATTPSVAPLVAAPPAPMRPVPRDPRRTLDEDALHLNDRPVYVVAKPETALFEFGAPDAPRWATTSSSTLLVVLDAPSNGFVRVGFARDPVDADPIELCSGAGRVGVDPQASMSLWVAIDSLEVVLRERLDHLGPTGSRVRAAVGTVVEFRDSLPSLIDDGFVVALDAETFATLDVGVSFDCRDHRCARDDEEGSDVCSVPAEVSSASLGFGAATGFSSIERVVGDGNRFELTGQCMLVDIVNATELEPWNCGNSGGGGEGGGIGLLGASVGDSEGIGGLGLGGLGHGGGSGNGIGMLGNGGAAPLGGPRIGAGIPEVAGGISADYVRRVVRRHVNEVRHCYEVGLATRPELAGRVVVDFVVDAAGAVSAAHVVENSTSSVEVGACIERAVGHWTFPASEEGHATRVRYPFTLTTDPGPTAPEPVATITVDPGQVLYSAAGNPIGRMDATVAVPIDTASSRESLTCFAVALMGAVEAHTLACVAR